MLELKNIKKIIEVINLASNFDFIQIKTENEFIPLFELYNWLNKAQYSALNITGICNFTEDKNYFYFSTITDCEYEYSEFYDLKILKSDFENVYNNQEKFQIYFDKILESRKSEHQKEINRKEKEERLEYLQERQDFLDSEKCSKMMEIAEKLNFTFGQDSQNNFWIKNLNDEYIYFYPQFRPSVDKISVEIIKKFIKK